MKAIALCFVLLGLCSAQYTNPNFCSARLSTGNNIAASGNFEGAADAWDLSNAAIVPSTDAGGCDGSSLKVDSTLGSASFSQYTTINKVNNRPFYFTAWLKGENVAFEDSSAASFNAIVDGNDCLLSVPTGTFDWTPVSAVCAGDSNPNFGILIQGSFSEAFTGTLYVENVNLCYFGTAGCAYDIFVNGYLLNGWTTKSSIGNVTISPSVVQDIPSLTATSPGLGINEFRFLPAGNVAIDNNFDTVFFKIVNPTNPVFLSVGPFKPKTFLSQTSSFVDASLSITGEESISMIILASIPTDYSFTAVGLV